MSMFEFEDSQAKGGNAADRAAEAKNDTLADLKHDIVEHVKIRYNAIVKAIVFPPIRVCLSYLMEDSHCQEHVLPPCQGLVEPFNSLIPEPLKDIFDLEQMTETIIEGIIDGAIDTATAPVTTAEHIFSGAM
jgi:hypothetical protein